MSNKGRVLTLVVQIDQDEYPAWIMDAHLKGPVNGVKVKSITEGNVPTLYDELSEVAVESAGSFDRNDALDEVLEKQGLT